MTVTRRPLPDSLVELIARRLRVLGQPLRIRLVDLLELRGETTVQALADELGATQQNMSKHLGLLRQAGILARRREGRVVWYTLVDEDAFALVVRVGDETVGRLQGLLDGDDSEWDE